MLCTITGISAGESSEERDLIYWLVGKGSEHLSKVIVTCAQLSTRIGISHLEEVGSSTISVTGKHFKI